MPQTVKNLDKAIAKIVLAGGENLEEKIKRRTQHNKAQGKIDVEGMYRTSEEKRKLENRAATAKAAAEDLNQNSGAEDAKSEIDDDWLNYFTRIAEDKSSEELQGLFGRILAGEIRAPGSFSLRTVQVLATMTRTEAEAISRFLRYALNGGLVAFEDSTTELSTELRMAMQELGIGGSWGQLSAIEIQYTAEPGRGVGLLGVGRAVVVVNNSGADISFKLAGQAVTKLGQEMKSIAILQETPMPYLKALAKAIYGKLQGSYPSQVEGKRITVAAGSVIGAAASSGQVRIEYNPADDAT